MSRSTPKGYGYMAPEPFLTSPVRHLPQTISEMRSRRLV